MQGKLRVELFGWLRAEAGNAIITRFRTRKTAALLGYLAYHSDRSHPREVLASLLWPESRDGASRNSLSQALTSLRTELSRSGEEIASLLTADRTTVQLHGRTDVAEFEDAIEKGDTRDERIGVLGRALQLYRGELLPGHYEEWVASERGRLRDLFLRANHELVTLLRTAGNLQAAVSAAHRATREDPLSEEAVRDLMLAHFDAHEPHMALRAYHELEGNLQREVGERPSAATRELARRIAAGHAENPASADLPMTRSHPIMMGTKTCLFVEILAKPAATSAFAGALSGARGRIKATMARLGGQALRDEATRIICSFPHPVSGLDCAVQLHEELKRLSWPSGESMDVVIALDTLLLSTRRSGDDSYADEAAQLGARSPAGHVILSDSTASLVRRDLEPGMRMVEVERTGGPHLYRLESGLAEVVPLRAAGV